ncbi:MAG TPA: ASPIC/UnbV domain-containing protein, partial [Candidatus Binatia bacterium]
HRNAWIGLQLVGGMGRKPNKGGKRSNRDGLGAKVTVTSGGHTQMAERRASVGYLSQNDPRMHFGLGAAERVERIDVRWPSGKTQTLTDVPARKVLVVEEPDD